MTNSGPLSSIISAAGTKRPLSLLHRPPIPFNMVNIKHSTPEMSASRSLYSLPNWARLGEAIDGTDVVEDGADAPVDHGAAASLNHNDTAANEHSGSDSPAENSIDLAPTYSTPQEASTAYQAGLLKSDFNIASNHRSIRLAFRHVLMKEEGGLKRDEDEAQVDDDAEEDLFLCWIRQDGIPCHFRSMRPVRNNATEIAVVDDDVNSTAGEEQHGNLRGAHDETQKQPDFPINDTNSTMLVNERDHIETTYPGHAFVFCRRVEYDHNASSQGHNETHNEEDPVVVNENNKTYFLRQKKCSQGEETKETASEEDEIVEWEAFLVVGGFRPGPMPGSVSDDESSKSSPEINGKDGIDNDDEGNEEGKQEENDDESDDDSSSGGSELSVQLVTILSTKTLKSNMATNDKREADDEDEDVDLPSKVMGCSDCTQSVPFLRGAMNPKPRHTPAFVATESAHEDVEGTLELPRRDDDQTTSGHCVLNVTVCITQLDPTPLDTSSKHYDEIILGGWPCRTEPGCFPEDMDVPESGDNLLRSRFEADLLAAYESLPPHSREKLKESTPVWINKSQSYGPKVAPVKARDGCFHPGAEWLARVGMNPAKCGGVEWFEAKHYLSDCDLWGPGGLMVHELSHAWHCLHVEDGFDNEEIIDVYKQAMDDGLYECVRVHGPQGPQCKAYACQDQMEYFAELSVAFLGGLDEREHNKWYPHNRAQLREHDPRAFAMLCRMWGVDDNTVRDENETSGQVDSSGEASGES